MWNTPSLTLEFQSGQKNIKFFTPVAYCGPIVSISRAYHLFEEMVVTCAGGKGTNAKQWLVGLI